MAGFASVATMSPSGIANADFAGLGSYSELMLVINARTCAIAQTCLVQASIDGGSSWLTASGDYKLLGTTGAHPLTDRTQIALTNVAGSPLSSVLWFPWWNLVGKWKQAFIISGNEGLTQFMVANNAALNALRVFNGASANFTGGTIYILGKP